MINQKENKHQSLETTTKIKRISNFFNKKAKHRETILYGSKSERQQLQRPNRGLQLQQQTCKFFAKNKLASC